MDTFIIRLFWWLHGLTVGDWMLAACITLLGLLLYQLTVAPVLERMHRNTWL